MQRGALIFFAAFFIASILYSCGSSKSGYSKGDSASPAFDPKFAAAVAALRELQLPEGAKGRVFAELKSEFEAKLKERANSSGKLVAAAPGGAGNRVTDLNYDAESRKLSWHYVNQGDYDLSGEVGVPDITPVAVHYLADCTDGIGDDPYEAWIDGSGDGVVGIPDITPIAVNYLVQLHEYAVRYSETGGDPWTEIGRITLTEAKAALPDGVSFPIEFVFDVPEGEFAFLRVLPLDATGNAGDSSNVVSTTGETPQRITLVDYGPSEAETETPFADWTQTLYHPSRTRFANPDGNPEHTGITEVAGIPDGVWAYYGIRGETPIEFSPGQRIIATFYNDSDNYLFLEARISFVDVDEPDPSEPEMTWFTMQNRLYEVDAGWMPPRELVEMEYYISDSGSVSSLNLIPSEGFHNLVNISQPYGDGRFVLTKIELSNDADFAPPTPPSNLSASLTGTAPGAGNNLIRLSWSESVDPGLDASGVNRYFIYRDGELYDSLTSDEIELMGANLHYIDLCVEPSTNYSYTVTAVDAAPYGLYPYGDRLHTRVGNESAPAGPVAISTGAWSGVSLIGADNFEYAGAFRLPEGMEDYWTYASGGLAYYPDGNAGYNHTTEYPGSLFATTLLQREIAEISIPIPAISANPDEMPRAALLRGPADVWPRVYGGGDPSVPPGGTDFKVAGIAYHPGSGGVPERIYYSTCNFYGTDAATPSMGWIGLDLESSGGAWHVGGEPPSNVYPGLIGRLAFITPQTWADAHTGGRTLIVGNSFLSGGDLIMHGPSLYAVAPWESGSLPLNGGSISAVRLLEYSFGTTLDNRVLNFTRDEFAEGGAWLEAGSKSAVAISFTRAVGDTWYGDSLGNLHATWDIPEPPMGDKGVCASWWRAGLMLYSPDDLAAVASGSKASHDPQPYLVYDFSGRSLRPDGGTGQAGAVAFDHAGGRLYYIEHNGDTGYEWGHSIIHVWNVR